MFAGVVMDFEERSAGAVGDALLTTAVGTCIVGQVSPDKNVNCSCTTASSTVPAGRRISFWRKQVGDAVAQADVSPIRDAVAVVRERLVLVIGARAGLSDYVRPKWQFALPADTAVATILRQGDYPLLPYELTTESAARLSCRAETGDFGLRTSR